MHWHQRNIGRQDINEGGLVAHAPAFPRRVVWWQNGSAVLLAAALLLLPKCPACVVGYVGVLGSLGLGFLPFDGGAVEPALVVLLLAAVASFGFRSWRFAVTGPFVASCLAASLVLIGRYAWDSKLVITTGVCCLIAACFLKTPLSGRPPDDRNPMHSVWESGSDEK